MVKFDKRELRSTMGMSILPCNQHLMGNTAKLSEAEGSNSLNRREVIGQLGALAIAATVTTAAGAQKVLADQVTPAAMPPREGWEDLRYRESDLGINYHELAEFPVSYMLSQGEAEFMENAAEVFGDETAEIWGDDMAPEVGTGRVSRFTVRDMREFTPNMLLQFSRIDPNHPKYMLLQTAGANFHIDQRLGN